MELTPSLIDWILIGVAAEFVLLLGLLAKARALAFAAPLFLFLLSGSLVFLAARLSLAGAAALLSGGALAGALLAHFMFLLWAAKRLLAR